MKNNILHPICIILIILSLRNIGYSQDIHFSQFLSSPHNINPSLTGDYPAGLRIIGNHRNQWQTITTPYKTTSFSLESNFNAFSRNIFGGGVFVNKDVAGDANFGTTQVMLSFSYHKIIGQKDNVIISGGLQTGYIQGHLDYNNLTFDNQWDGEKYNPDIKPSQFASLDQTDYWDYNCGFRLKYIASDKFNANAGFGIFHLLRPGSTYFEEKIEMYRRFAIHSSAEYKATDDYTVMPLFLYQMQGKFSEIDLGVHNRIAMNSESIPAIYAGAWYRLKDAVIFQFGFDIKSLNIGFSYDLNISSAAKASSGVGAFEIAIIYLLKKAKEPKAPVRDCPVFF